VSVPGRVHGGGQLTKSFFRFFTTKSFFSIFQIFLFFSFFRGWLRIHPRDPTNADSSKRWGSGETPRCCRWRRQHRIELKPRFFALYSFRVGCNTCPQIGNPPSAQKCPSLKGHISKTIGPIFTKLEHDIKGL